MCPVCFVSIVNFCLNLLLFAPPPLVAGRPPTKCPTVAARGPPTLRSTGIAQNLEASVLVVHSMEYSRGCLSYPHCLYMLVSFFAGSLY